MQLNWEEAHSQALRDCLAKGMSFSEAARALNERFGTAYSRNAAIGRARRMGFSAPERIKLKRLPKPPKPGPKRLRKLRDRVASGVAAKAGIRERADALQLRCVAIIPRHLALVDLKAGDCRYPYGGDVDGEPITFCGHPRREGSSYCLSHFHLTSMPRTEVEKPAPRTALRLVEAA